MILAIMQILASLLPSIMQPVDAAYWFAAANEQRLAAMCPPKRFDKAAKLKLKLFLQGNIFCIGKGRNHSQGVIIKQKAFPGSTDLHSAAALMLMLV